MGAAAVTVTAVLLSACGAGGDASSTSDKANDGKTPVRIGYIANIPYAPAMVADKEGFFRTRLGEGVTIQIHKTAGEATKALSDGSVDIAYVGPMSAVSAYVRSGGAAIRVISGATSGGASLVVRKGITDAAGLKGRKIATPRGSTQDVALRYWLSQQGLTSDAKGGDVKIAYLSSPTAVRALISRRIDGAWLSEPYVTQLTEKGVTVLVDERTLWPDRKFVTTNVVVLTTFHEQHPEVVKGFLEAHVDAMDLLEKAPMQAQADVLAQMKSLGGGSFETRTVAKAWTNITYTMDPLPQTLKATAEHADAVGLLGDKPTDGLEKLWDLDILNKVLKARGFPEVTVAT